ncbi:MAG: GAF domain-containing protein, partial [Bacteroidales bacterium]|nr:GAF domain-containing protein [Bacteroidales bacterium]
MNSAAEKDTMASVKKFDRTMLNPASWSMKWKILLNFLIRAIVAIGLLIAIVYLIQRRNSIQEASDKLLLLTEAKSTGVNEYFDHISEKLAAFSTDRYTLEAFNQLNSAFLGIENDNYYTPTVTSIDRFRLLTEGFYNTEILPALNGVTTDDINLKALLPDDNRQLIMQYLYLAGNSKALGSKHIMVKAEDGSTYSYMHAQYHPEMIKATRNAGISDIIFVDYKTGYVTYSVKKNLDFGTSLFEGPYKNSGLGIAFKSAIAGKSQGAISFTDVTLYLPDIYKPCLFISAPVYSGTQLLGAVIFKIDVAALDRLLAIDKDRLNFGHSLKTVLIGPDLLYRNNDPEFSENPDRYLRKLKHHASNADVVLKASEFRSTALIQPVDPKAFDEALSGKEKVIQYTTETGNKALCSYAPLKVGNLKWIVVSQINTADALASLHRLMRILIVITLLIAVILYFISNLINKSVNERLVKLAKNMTSLARGERLKDLEGGPNDEIGQTFSALKKLNSRISYSSSFVAELGKGNIEHDFPVESEDDSFGLSMNNLKQNLVIRREEEEKRKKEDEIRNWTTQGIASFNDVLRMDNSDLDKLSISIVRNLIDYLKACQGALFLIEEEETKYLNLVAAYAYDRQKFMKKRIEIGEGMAGTCVLEKKTILTNKIPDNYISITSGLGGSKPKCLLIVPLKKDNEVLGVLELASLEDFKPHEVELVEKVGESIASALITVKLHVQTSQYLER